MTINLFLAVAAFDVLAAASVWALFVVDLLRHL
jgi:hypothetical protein